MIKFNTKFIFNQHYVAASAIINNNQKILKHLKRKGYDFDDYDWIFAIKSQQLQVLKWRKIMDTDFIHRYLITQLKTNI